jgi:hypothetical protein
MKEEFKNLAAAFNIFTEEYDLCLDQNIASLDLSIKQGYIDEAKLKEELNVALDDPSFEWVNFATTNRLIVYDIEKYTNEKVKEYFKSLVWGYLYPKST